MFQVAPANRAIIPKYHFNRESRHNRSVVTLWNLPRPLKGLRVSEPWFRMPASEIGNVPRLRPTLGREPTGWLWLMASDCSWRLSCQSAFRIKTVESRRYVVSQPFGCDHYTRAVAMLDRSVVGSIGTPASFRSE